MLGKGQIRTTIDHHEIQEWVERRNGKPGIEKESKKLKISFSDNDFNFEKLEWIDFLLKFDQEKLTFKYKDFEDNGEESNYYEIIEGSSFR